MYRFTLAGDVRAYRSITHTSIAKRVQRFAHVFNHYVSYLLIVRLQVLVSKPYINLSLDRLSVDIAS